MGKLRNDQTGFSILEPILILIIIATIGAVGLFVWHSKQAADKLLSTTTSASPTFKKKAASGAAASIQSNGTLNTYTNKTLGFSFDFPKTVYAENGCTTSATVHDNYGKLVDAPTHHVTTSGLMPTTIVNKNNDYYITTTSTAELTGVADATVNGNSGYSLASSCVITPVTADLIEKYHAPVTIVPSYANISSLQLIAAIKTPGNSLNSEVQQIFSDPTLKVSSITADSKAAWSTLSFVCDGKSEPLGGCANLGGSYTLHYYQKTSLLVFWATGQACKLQSDFGATVCYDPQIINSFKIIN